MKRLTALVLIIVLMFLCIPCNAANLGTPSPWASEDIADAANHGVTADAVTSKYTDNITREEFTSLIVPVLERMHGEITPAPADTFSDTDSVYVLKAVSADVAYGTGDGKFNPDALITRQEIAVMLCRAIGFVESSIACWIIGAHPELIQDNTAEIAHYDDYDQIATWAQKQVALLNKHQIMVGTSSNTISPLSNVSVQQAIILTSRVAKGVFGI